MNIAEALIDQPVKYITFSDNTYENHMEVTVEDDYIYEVDTDEFVS